MPAQRLSIGDLETRSSPAVARDEVTLIGVARGLSRDQAVFVEGSRAEFVYKVVSGAVRTFRLLADGRRQIIGFHLPGDLFGIEANSVHGATAEAICDSVLVSARRASLLDDREQQGRLMRHALNQLHRSQDHLLTLGRRSAVERVAGFLTDLADRTGAADSVALPMSRQDIADYLGLTIETVSRTLTQMQARGLVRLHGCRRLQLLKPRALTDLCE
jgi:CRP/FNR family transcriptional regulator, nitrogen fixation regulation protein